VQLTKDYKNHEEVPGVPLKPGEVGVVIKVDDSDNTFQVRAANGEEWWYDEEAIEPVVMDNPTDEHGARVAVAGKASPDKVHAKEKAKTEAEAKDFVKKAVAEKDAAEKAAAEVKEKEKKHKEDNAFRHLLEMGVTDQSRNALLLEGRGVKRLP
jgi:hypothetical protein